MYDATLRIIDYHKDRDNLKITNLGALPSGLGARYLLVIDSPYPNEYVARQWLRKLPKTVDRCQWIIRF